MFALAAALVILGAAGRALFGLKGPVVLRCELSAAAETPRPTTPASALPTLSCSRSQGAARFAVPAHQVSAGMTTDAVRFFDKH